jgi:DNA invertase Pin-like site-specific DNA recombinase
VVYKVDRLTRSLADSFVSVTQQFNTTTSMGRLTLTVRAGSHFRAHPGQDCSLQAQRTVGGGPLPLGYELKDGKLTVVEEEAERVRMIFRRYLEVSGINEFVRDLRANGTPRDNLRPERTERRARLVCAIARGRRWLQEIVTGSVTLNNWQSASDVP